jgi:sensor histidine kinase regulating citrate/malate metabolism
MLLSPILFTNLLVTGIGFINELCIVKALGGEIKVETHSGEGTIFIIQHPVE